MILKILDFNPEWNEESEQQNLDRRKKCRNVLTTVLRENFAKMHISK